ncbi:hypothetical protein ACWKWP_14860, partial [Agromyces soli]
MRILRRTLIVVAGLVAVVLIAVTAVYWWQRPMLLTGTGYAAHNACAVTQLAGRDDPATDLPPNPLVPYLSVEGAGDPTTGSLLGVLAKQRAWYAEGFGCTLAGERPARGPPRGGGGGGGPARGGGGAGRPPPPAPRAPP